MKFLTRSSPQRSWRDVCGAPVLGGRGPARDVLVKVASFSNRKRPTAQYIYINLRTWFNFLVLSSPSFSSPSLSLLAAYSHTRYTLPPPSLGMLVDRFARVVLATATLLGLSVAAKTHCFNPSVRREWRSLAPFERAEWITAVKVKHPTGHSSRVTDTPMPSASTRCLTTLLWCQNLTTETTLRFHLSIRAVLILTVC